MHCPDFHWLTSCVGLSAILAVAVERSLIVIWRKVVTVWNSCDWLFLVSVQSVYGLSVETPRSGILTGDIGGRWSVFMDGRPALEIARSRSLCPCIAGNFPGVPMPRFICQRLLRASHTHSTNWNINAVRWPTRYNSHHSSCQQW